MTLSSRNGLPSAIRNQGSAYGVHPALLDACFQSVAAHPGVQTSGTGGLLLPLGVRRLRATLPLRRRAKSSRPTHTRRRSKAGSTIASTCRPAMPAPRGAIRACICFTVAANMSDQPAVSVHAGLTAGGLPIGLQITGRRFDDLGVLRMARAWEKMRGPVAWP